MNKTKKIAAAAISIVMAGTMAGSLAACTPKNNTPKQPTIKTLEYASGTKVTTSIGYSTSEATGITFGSTLPLKTVSGTAGETTTGAIKFPDGVEYQKGSLKPVWNAYKTALNINIDDKWTRASDNLEECIKNLDDYCLIGSGNTATIQSNTNLLLNLADYMDYLPNLRQFLDNNALAELGTLSDVDSGAVYYAPYYGGMNDVERFNLFRRDYVSELLDHATLDATNIAQNGGTITFKAQADAKTSAGKGNRKTDEAYDGSKSSIESYMGKTGNYVIETTNPGDTLHTIFVKVNYDAALTAAKKDTTPLGSAIKDAAGVAYDGSSGNIVDLQNFVINKKAGEVTGEHLLKILRAYIDVTYEWSATKNGTYAQFYNATVNGVATKRGDIINASWAAWDVDIYAAIGRCFVTCGNLLGEYQAQGGASNHTNNGVSTWLFAPRTGYANRTTRIPPMIGELYGVRGMETNQYFDASGHYRDMRFNVASWDALTKFSAFHTEGLMPSFNKDNASNEVVENGSSTNSLYFGNDNYFQSLSTNDFLPSQTTFYSHENAQGKKGDETPGKVQTTDGYDWNSVVTPVSKWLTNDTSKLSDTSVVTPDFNGKLSERPENKCEIMRFTESALKLKPGGLVIPKSLENNSDKLHATLALLDYMFSNDGMIETTFGTRSDRDNLTGTDADGYATTNNGWWYGKEVTSVNGIDITGKSMEDLKKAGIVTTVSGKVQGEEGKPASGREVYDATKSYTMTKEYQGYALVYKNKLYRTGTDGGDYDTGYVYNGKMTPYYTRAVRKLCEGKAVNGYQPQTWDEKAGKWTAAVWSDVSIKNLALGQEGFGIVENASAVQLYNPMATKGADTFSAALGNGSIQTVTQNVDKNKAWYICPTSVVLPDEADKTSKSYSDFSAIFKADKNVSNYFTTEVGWYGAAASLASWEISDANKGGDVSSPEKIVAYMKQLAPQWESLYNASWYSLYNYITSK